jgi:CheY-like chemotaxis protein
MEKPKIQQPVPNILVVDDTPANLHLLTEMLKELGYKVRSVSSGKFALQTAKHNPPDLILLDVIMPEYLRALYRTCSGTR